MSDARARLADVVDAARVGHDPVYLTRRGQRVAAVIDADDDLSALCNRMKQEDRRKGAILFCEGLSGIRRFFKH